MISLIYATYHRAGGQFIHAREWLDKAKEPDFLEIVIAGDEDDSFDLDLESIPNLQLIINEAMKSGSSAVRNWNAAAEVSTGDLLFVISDDLHPIEGWDSEIRKIVEGLDAKTLPFAIKIKDNPRPKDRLMRHPIISRNFYQNLGLFDGRFRGLYCDNDITSRAFFKAVILDGRSITFTHRHPSLSKEYPTSSSHSRMNSTAEYEYGIKVISAIWPYELWKAPVSLCARPLQLKRKPVFYFVRSIRQFHSISIHPFLVIKRRSRSLVSRIVRKALK